MNSSNKNNENPSDLLKLLITVFGIFFGGWWTSLYTDVFNSSTIPMLNKVAYVFYLLIPFLSFYSTLYARFWRIQAVFFVLIDAMNVIGTINMLSPNPVMSGEAFVMKAIMALISLCMLQMLVLHYLKLTFGTTIVKTSQVPSAAHDLSQV